jgi:hypothetical protein
MINYTGIKFYLNLLGEPIQKNIVGFDFSSGSFNGGLLYPDFSSNFALTGLVFNESVFVNNKPGFFDKNNYIYFNSNIDYQKDNYLFLISYEKFDSKDSILFSSVDEVNDEARGFFVGVNSANKLYYKYNNGVEGVFTFTFDEILSDKNLIMVGKDGSNISIGRFDNNTFNFETRDFEIFNNSIINANKLFIGGSPVRNFIQNDVDNLYGLIDRFYYFEDIPSIYANDLALGLYSSPREVQGFSREICYTTGYFIDSGFSYTGITGYQLIENVIYENQITGVTSIETGILYYTRTGKREDLVGYFLDSCNIERPIYETVYLSGFREVRFTTEIALTGLVPRFEYENIEITGTITGSEKIFITEDVCDSFTVVTGDLNYSIDTDYLKSLSFSEVSLYFNTEETSENLIEIYKENYKANRKYFNIPALYDSVRGKHFLNRNYKNSDILLFANGQLLIDGGYSGKKIGYEELIGPLFDYYLTGRNIETEKFFTENDVLTVDNITGNYSIYLIGSIFSGMSISDASFDNSFVFLNGQKLISGKDYELPNFLNFDLISSRLNLLYVKNLNSDFSYTFDSRSTVELDSNFNNYCTHVYLNGIKQTIDKDYIENSKFDRISGSFSFGKNLDLIYDNTDDFFFVYR